VYGVFIAFVHEMEWTVIICSYNDVFNSLKCFPVACNARPYIASLPCVFFEVSFVSQIYSCFAGVFCCYNELGPFFY
jgi:hypothetical protein